MRRKHLTTSNLTVAYKEWDGDELREKLFEKCNHHRYNGIKKDCAYTREDLRRALCKVEMWGWGGKGEMVTLVVVCLNLGKIKNVDSIIGLRLKFFCRRE